MKCNLCPVQCNIDRSVHTGRCGVQGLTIAKYYLHPYEEPPISHKNGSGTIFFCGCSLRCVFCQNYELSRMERGKDITTDELCDIFKKLEDMGADNINLVTPDHVSNLIGEALSKYKPRIPVVYNSSGYCLISSLKEIDEYVDIYLPDVKFCSPALSKRYTGREDYFERSKECIAFMAKKPVVFDETGKMLSGILARHLVMPMCVSDTFRVLDFLKQVLPENAPLSLMRQYTPAGDIKNYPELRRKLTSREYRRALDYAKNLNFPVIYTQEKESSDPRFVPAWDF